MNPFIKVKDYLLLEEPGGDLSLVVNARFFENIDILKVDISLNNNEVLIFPIRGSGHKNISIKVNNTDYNKMNTKDKIILSLVNESNEFEIIVEVKITR